MTAAPQRVFSDAALGSVVSVTHFNAVYGKSLLLRSVDFILTLSPIKFSEFLPSQSVDWNG